MRTREKSAILVAGISLLLFSVGCVENYQPRAEGAEVDDDGSQNNGMDDVPDPQPSPEPDPQPSFEPDPQPSPVPEDPGACGQAQVDCAQGGDREAQCQEGQCLCSDAFVCADGSEVPCADGVSCVFQEPEGTRPDSCGTEELGVEAIDCTVAGDLNAVCVFGHHCGCSEGFVCAAGDRSRTECEPGEICVPQAPDGARSTNCGSEDQGLEPVNCESEGDEAAACVFGNHCLCSEGFVCEGGGRECLPGEICVAE